MSDESGPSRQYNFAAPPSSSAGADQLTGTDPALGRPSTSSHYDMRKNDSGYLLAFDPVSPVSPMQHKPRAKTREMLTQVGLNHFAATNTPYLNGIWNADTINRSFDSYIHDPNASQWSIDVYGMQTDLRIDKARALILSAYRYAKDYPEEASKHFSQDVKDCVACHRVNPDSTVGTDHLQALRRKAWLGQQASRQQLADTDEADSHQQQA